MRPRSSFALLLLAACPLAAPRLARADDPLPSAETVLNQYVEATGGKAAYESVKNRVAKGTLEVASAGIKGSIKVIEAAPNNMRVEVEIPNVEKNVEATNGEVAWSISALTGERFLEGEEKDALLLRSAHNSELNWKTLYAKAECTGVEDVDGKPAYKIVLTPKTGKPTIQFYDKASHLIVKTTIQTKGPMGELNVEGYPSDFRKVDGLLIPFVAKQKVLTQEIVITMTEVKQNVDLPADTFKVPASIQELIDKAKKAK